MGPTGWAESSWSQSTGCAISGEQETFWTHLLPLNTARCEYQLGGKCWNKGEATHVSVETVFPAPCCPLSFLLNWINYYEKTFQSPRMSVAEVWN